MSRHAHAGEAPPVRNLGTSGSRWSIRTEYRGVLFRSKLEADWARCFDALDIKWEYEPVGRYFGDTFYLVDFWLPRSRQWVEVKGVFEPDDCRKIQSLLRHVEPRPHTGEFCPDIPIVACEPDGVFRGWLRTQQPTEDWLRFLTTAARTVELFCCTACHGWWFGDPDESWICQCCGHSDGNSHLAAAIPSPIPEFPSTHALHFHARDL